jgi:Methyltransferase domain
MDYRKRFLEIYDFLSTYQKIWQNEIMLLYPDYLAEYPYPWVKDLARVRVKSDIIRLEMRDIHGLVSDPELIAFYDRIEELCDVPFIGDYPPMPVGPHTFLYMIPKKQYEVKRLAPVIHALTQTQKIKKIVDIGGGIGLLAQSLSNQYGHSVTSLDLDPIMQQTGVTRGKRYAKNPQHLVDYQNIKVDEKNVEFLNCLNSETLSVGLHTCGPLANAQIRGSATKKVAAIINFGCCFQKLENVPDSENISQFAQGLPAPLKMSHFALTLACRAHQKMNDDDYDLKLKVKLYRYAIHMLLYDHYAHRSLATLGNSKPALYDESFGVYVYEQFRRIQQEPKHTIDELNEYFRSEEKQKMIWEMLAAGLIRNSMGRVMELYLMLDRVLYLEEQNYKVDLWQFFDEEVSPRNLGIVASRI